MSDLDLHARARAFVQAHYPWIDRAEHLRATTVACLAAGWLVRVSMAAGMLQMSVVVASDGAVRLASADETASDPLVVL
jgi:hypothetical protein